MEQFYKKIKNKNDLDLNTRVTLPSESGNFPTIVLVHGFSGSMYENHIKTLALYLARVDIASIAFDASGLGTSSGTVKDDYRFSNQLGDVDSIVEWLNEQDWFNKAKLGIWGHSMGGEIVLFYAAQNPNVKAVVSCQGVGDPMDLPIIQKRMQTMGDSQSYKHTSGSYGDIEIPRQFFEDYFSYHISEISSLVHQKILFIAGGADESISIDHVKSTASLFSDKAEYFEVASARHDFKHQPEELRIINNKTTEWLLHNI
jgi:pimeloyl-ACP methyl ester carboxylesterase